MPHSTLGSTKVLKTPKRRSRAVVKLAIQMALRKKFPHDTIDISDGFEGNIHIVIVSRVFDRMSERARLAHIWKVIEGADLSSAEKNLITLIFAVSPRELV
ncbi:MAG: hypothetical protein JWM97_740 [Phycisphaerales bacterium]|nr:hypothetical protein [Phycisphaerales bacterium]